jgi:hypothetical protein
VSVKRALGVLAFAITAGGVGSAVLVGTAATGSPSAPAAPAVVVPAAPPAAAPEVPAPPKTKLHLPSTLRVINTTVGAIKLNNSHLLFQGAVSKPGSKKVIGTASYTCVARSSPTLQQVCKGALALRGGVLLITEVLNISTNEISGKVSGGNGSFAGARGDIVGRSIFKGKDKLTISYSLR